MLSLGKVQKVLQNLLKEQVSIRDLRTILEQLADYGPTTQDTDILTEYVRQAMARPITKQFQSEDGSLSVMTLDQGSRRAYSKLYPENGNCFLFSIGAYCGRKITCQTTGSC